MTRKNRISFALPTDSAAAAGTPPPPPPNSAQKFEILFASLFTDLRPPSPSIADPPPVLTLLVKKGPCEGKTLQRRAGAAALRVGRVAKGNDLSVGDAGASQRHLSVEFLPPPAARWVVTDLGSSNGTLLNGTPIVATIPAPLSDGDLIKIGETTMLAVSISTDAGPGPGPAATRRSARNAAAAEEQGPAVSRRAGRRKAGVAEAPEAGNEVEEEAALPTRRGGRKKAGAAEAPEAGHEVEEEPAIPTRRGGRKKAGAAEAPDAGNEVEEEAALPTRRGGRKKADGAEAPETGNEVEEEAALPSRRGGRKKAVEPAVVEMEAEDEEEAAIPRRGRSRKAAVTFVLPPQPQNTRSARAAASRGEVLGCENDEGEVVRTGRGRGRVTLASARNGTGVTPEEEEEGEVAVARDREGTAAEGKGEVVPAAGRGRAKRGRGGRGRGRATRASTKKAEDAIVENDENEQEGKDMADGRERVGSPLRVLAVNDSSEEDMVATEDDKLDGNSKASVEDEKMDVEEDATLTEGAIEGRVNAQHAPAGNGGVEEEEVKNLSKGGAIAVDQELREKVSPGSKLGGVGEVEKNDKKEAIGASGEKGNVGERKGRHRLEDMTLGEWFVQIEKYLLAKNEQAAEKAIAEVQEKHWLFCEHVKSLNLKKSPAP